MSASLGAIRAPSARNSRRISASRRRKGLRAKAFPHSSKTCVVVRRTDLPRSGSHRRGSPPRATGRTARVTPGWPRCQERRHSRLVLVVAFGKGRIAGVLGLAQQLVDALLVPRQFGRRRRLVQARRSTSLPSGKSTGVVGRNTPFSKIAWIAFINDSPARRIVRDCSSVPSFLEARASAGRRSG